MNEQSEHTRASMIPRLMQLQSLLRRAAPAQPWLDLDLTMPQFKLLLLVASRNGARVGDLAHRLGVTAPTVTTILDRLVSHGFVRREDDPIDRRLVIIRLTSLGKSLLQRLHVQAEPDPSEYLAELAEEDLRCLLVGLEALHRAWEARYAGHANGNDPEAC